MGTLVVSPYIDISISRRNSPRIYKNFRGNLVQNGENVGKVTYLIGEKKSAESDNLLASGRLKILHPLIGE